MKKSISLFVFLFLALILVALPILAACAQPAPAPTPAPAPPPTPPIELKAVSAWGPVLKENFDNWKAYLDAINKAGAGKVVIKVLGGPEIAPPVEFVTHMTKGTFDLCETAPSYYEKSVPVIKVNELLRPEDYTSGWFRTSGFMDVYNEYVIAQGKVRPLLVHGTRQDSMFATGTKPITSGDMTGLKIRSPGAVGTELLKKLGAGSVVVAPAELADALQKGITDGVWTHPNGMVFFKWYEYLKYLTGPVPLSLSSTTYISEDKWQKLPKDVQDIITKVSLEYETKYRNFWVDVERRDVKFMIDKGIKYNELSPAEFEKITNAWKFVWDTQFVPNLPPGAADKFNKIMEGHALWNKHFTNSYSDLVSK